LTDLNIPTIQSTCEKRYVMQNVIQRGWNDTKGMLSKQMKENRKQSSWKGKAYFK